MKNSLAQALTESRKFRKATTAAVVGFASAIGTALLDGALNRVEVLAAFGAGVLAGVAVYKATNAPQ